jgi:hypothetical protein
MDNELYDRKCSLLLVAGDEALDLSEMHITFEVKQEDEESPNNARIRVNNLSPDLVKRIKGEYGRVVLQAGYVGAYYGVIFDGTIKQWHEGREPNKVDTFLDILAADGDLAYNFSVVNACLRAGSTRKQRLDTVIRAMQSAGIKPGKLMVPETGGVLPRGKVLFGLARAALRGQTQNFGATWSMQNGDINIVPLADYLPGTEVVLNSMTGLVGRVEQTQEGVKARCLINPRIAVGGLVQIDNALVNQTSQQKDHVIPGAQLPYNQWTGIQNLADITADGLYRVYVAEYKGDNRGQAWWMDLILLAVDPVTKKVKEYG